MANRNRKKLKIHWKAHKKTDEYIDLIPYKWFEHDVDDEDKRYSITDLRGRYATEARCKVSVSGSQATLYYGGSNEKYNKRKGIYIGTTRVTFRGENRSGVRKVEWEDEHNFMDFFIFFIKYIFYIHVFDTNTLGQFWLEIDKANGQGQHEPRRSEEKPGQVVWYTGRIKRWLVMLVVMLIVAVIVLW